MRMSRGRGETAGAFLATADEAELTRILATYGEEPRARRIARGIVRAREEAPLGTTSDLRRVVERSVPGRDVIPCLSRTFQALRIRVNRELENLDVFLETAPGLLAGRGVLCVISYHSLEDRRVKRAMRRWGRNCICPPGLPECRCGHEAEVEVLTRRVRVPSAEEVAANPRSRSARLRACRRL